MASEPSVHNGPVAYVIVRYDSLRDSNTPVSVTMTEDGAWSESERLEEGVADGDGLIWIATVPLIGEKP